MQKFEFLWQPLLWELEMSPEVRERREERKNAIYSGHLRLCQQPRAAHALRSDQHFHTSYTLISWNESVFHPFPALSLSAFPRIQIFLPAFYVFLLNVFFLLPCYRRYGMIQFVFNKINNFIERHNMTFATPVQWPHVKLGLFESQKNNHRKIRSHVVFFVSWL